MIQRLVSQRTRSISKELLMQNFKENTSHMIKFEKHIFNELYWNEMLNMNIKKNVKYENF